MRKPHGNACYAGYIFSMALQFQAKEEFSATQDKSEAVKVQALTTACAGEWSSMSRENERERESRDDG